jgi:hypothetical protein
LASFAPKSLFSNASAATSMDLRQSGSMNTCGAIATTPRVFLPDPA